ncbi:hypothetical protein Sliba_09440 [Streptomyces nigrescens]|uniref:Uncharacterized protein n=1 Tax=Streptomyces nigrescens TaxID=1920 RepID=A0A640TDB4_STRNI|nr:hypothetical protein Sliba_09440 [Streptomyces libani subsp. libani]GGV87204.1 hypothetical protein GCM10010500_06880 [Streptomyces libani subsp. libani]
MERSAASPAGGAPYDLSRVSSRDATANGPTYGPADGLTYGHPARPAHDDARPGTARPAPDRA